METVTRRFWPKRNTTGVKAMPVATFRRPLFSSRPSEAFRYLRSDQRIDLLVTDEGLPGGMNGRQVADAARGARAGLRVLFITGYAEYAVPSHGHLDACIYVLTKPFDLSVLVRRVRESIESEALG